MYDDLPLPAADEYLGAHSLTAALLGGDVDAIAGYKPRHAKPHHEKPQPPAPEGDPAPDSGPGHD